MVEVSTPKPHFQCIQQRSAKKRRAPYSRFSRQPSSPRKAQHDDFFESAVVKRQRGGQGAILQAAATTPAVVVSNEECVAQDTFSNKCRTPTPQKHSVGGRLSISEDHSTLDNLCCTPRQINAAGTPQDLHTPPCRRNVHLDDEGFYSVTCAREGSANSCATPRTPNASSSHHCSLPMLHHNTHKDHQVDVPTPPTRTFLPQFPSNFIATTDSRGPSSESKGLSVQLEDSYVASSVEDSSPNAASAAALEASSMYRRVMLIPSPTEKAASVTPSPRTPCSESERTPAKNFATPKASGNILEGKKLPKTPQAPLRPKVFGQTMSYGIKCGNKRVIMRAMQAGADPNVEIPFEQGAEPILPILASAALGQASIVRCLLEGGAAPNSVNNIGQTALHLLSILITVQRQKEAQQQAQAAKETAKGKAWIALENLLSDLSPEQAENIRLASTPKPLKEKNISDNVPSFCRSSLLDRKESLDKFTISESDLLLTAQILLAAGTNVHKKDRLGYTAIDNARLAGLTRLEALLNQHTTSSFVDCKFDDNRTGLCLPELVSDSTTSDDCMDTDFNQLKQQQQRRRKYGRGTEEKFCVTRSGCQLQKQTTLPEGLCMTVLPPPPQPLKRERLRQRSRAAFLRPQRST